MLQAECPSVGWCPAGVCAEGAECVRLPKRKREEGCLGWADICSFTEDRSITTTEKVQTKNSLFYTYKWIIDKNTHVFQNCSEIQMLPSSKLSWLCAGTESCVDICESSSPMNPNCEFWNLFNVPTLLFSKIKYLRDRIFLTPNIYLSCSLQQVRDLIPFFMCMEGDFLSAVDSLLPAVNAPALRLTPHLFLFYLCIFRTATAPRLAVSQSAQLCYSDAAWELIKGLSRIVDFHLSIHFLKKTKNSFSHP